MSETFQRCGDMDTEIKSRFDAVICENYCNSSEKYDMTKDELKRNGNLIANRALSKDIFSFFQNKLNVLNSQTLTKCKVQKSEGSERNTDKLDYITDKINQKIQISEKGDNATDYDNIGKYKSRQKSSKEQLNRNIRNKLNVKEIYENPSLKSSKKLYNHEIQNVACGLIRNVKVKIQNAESSIIYVKVPKESGKELLQVKELKRESSAVSINDVKDEKESHSKVSQKEICKGSQISQLERCKVSQKYICSNGAQKESSSDESQKESRKLYQNTIAKVNGNTAVQKPHTKPYVISGLHLEKFFKENTSNSKDKKSALNHKTKHNPRGDKCYLDALNLRQSFNARRRRKENSPPQHCRSLESGNSLVHASHSREKLRQGNWRHTFKTYSKTVEVWSEGKFKDYAIPTPSTNISNVRMCQPTELSSSQDVMCTAVKDDMQVDKSLRNIKHDIIKKQENCDVSCDMEARVGTRRINDDQSVVNSLSDGLDSTTQYLPRGHANDNDDKTNRQGNAAGNQQQTPSGRQQHTGNGDKGSQKLGARNDDGDDDADGNVDRSDNNRKNDNFKRKDRSCDCSESDDPFCHCGSTKTTATSSMQSNSTEGRSSEKGTAEIADSGGGGDVKKLDEVMGGELGALQKAALSLNTEKLDDKSSTPERQKSVDGRRENGKVAVGTPDSGYPGSMFSGRSSSSADSLASPEPSEHGKNGIPSRNGKVGCDESCKNAEGDSPCIGPCSGGTLNITEVDFARTKNGSVPSIRTQIVDDVGTQSNCDNPGDANEGQVVAEVAMVGHCEHPVVEFELTQKSGANNECDLKAVGSDIIGCVPNSKETGIGLKIVENSETLQEPKLMGDGMQMKLAVFSQTEALHNKGSIDTNLVDDSKSNVRGINVNSQMLFDDKSSSNKNVIVTGENEIEASCSTLIGSENKSLLMRENSVFDGDSKVIILNENSNIMPPQESISSNSGVNQEKNIRSNLAFQLENMCSNAEVQEESTGINSNIPLENIGSDLNIPQENIDSNFNIPQVNIGSNLNIPIENIDSDLNIPQENIGSNLNVPEETIPQQNTSNAGSIDMTENNLQNRDSEGVGGVNYDSTTVKLHAHQPPSYETVDGVDTSVELTESEVVDIIDGPRNSRWREITEKMCESLICFSCTAERSRFEQSPTNVIFIDLIQHYVKCNIQPLNCNRCKCVTTVWEQHHTFAHYVPPTTNQRSSLLINRNPQTRCNIELCQKRTRRKNKRDEHRDRKGVSLLSVTSYRSLDPVNFNVERNSNTLKSFLTKVLYHGTYITQRESQEIQAQISSNSKDEGEDSRRIGCGSGGDNAALVSSSDESRNYRQFRPRSVFSSHEGGRLNALLRSSGSSQENLRSLHGLKFPQSLVFTNSLKRERNRFIPAASNVDVRNNGNTELDPFLALENQSSITNTNVSGIYLNQPQSLAGELPMRQTDTGKLKPSEEPDTNKELLLLNLRSSINSGSTQVNQVDSSTSNDECILNSLMDNLELNSADNNNQNLQDETLRNDARIECDYNSDNFTIDIPVVLDQQQPPAPLLRLRSRPGSEINDIDDIESDGVAVDMQEDLMLQLEELGESRSLGSRDGGFPEQVAEVFETVEYGDAFNLNERAGVWMGYSDIYENGGCPPGVHNLEGIILGEYRQYLIINEETCTYNDEGEQWERIVFLGNGMSGECYLAQDKTSEFKFCVKIMNLLKFDSDELAVLTKLNHDKVIKVFGALRRADEIYLLSEYIDGGTLKDFILKEGDRGVNMQLALSFTRDLLHALVYLQERSIIHEDLKADNIMVKNWDSSPYCVLIDFGLSRDLEFEMGQYMDKVDPVGGPTHWSPEKARSERYDYKSDVWAIMCDLLHMLAGIEPWIRRLGGNTNHLHMLYLIGHAAAAPLEDIPDGRSDITQELRDFIEYAMNPKPERRPSARELLQHHVFRILDNPDEIRPDVNMNVDDDTGPRLPSILDSYRDNNLNINLLTEERNMSINQLNESRNLSISVNRSIIGHNPNLANEKLPDLSHSNLFTNQIPPNIVSTNQQPPNVGHNPVLTSINQPDVVRPRSLTNNMTLTDPHTDLFRTDRNNGLSVLNQNHEDGATMLPNEIAGDLTESSPSINDQEDVIPSGIPDFEMIEISLSEKSGEQKISSLEGNNDSNANIIDVIARGPPSMMYQPYSNNNGDLNDNTNVIPSVVNKMQLSLSTTVSDADSSFFNTTEFPHLVPTAENPTNTETIDRDTFQEQFLRESLNKLLPSNSDNHTQAVDDNESISILSFQDRLENPPDHNESTTIQSFQDRLENPPDHNESTTIQSFQDRLENPPDHNESTTIQSFQDRLENPLDHNVIEIQDFNIAPEENVKSGEEEDDSQRFLSVGNSVAYTSDDFDINIPELSEFEDNSTVYDDAISGMHSILNVSSEKITDEIPNSASNNSMNLNNNNLAALDGITEMVINSRKRQLDNNGERVADTGKGVVKKKQPCYEAGSQHQNQLNGGQHPQLEKLHMPDHSGEPGKVYRANRTPSTSNSTPGDRIGQAARDSTYWARRPHKPQTAPAELSQLAEEETHVMQLNDPGLVMHRSFSESPFSRQHPPTDVPQTPNTPGPRHAPATLDWGHNYQQLGNNRSIEEYNDFTIGRASLETAAKTHSKPHTEQEERRERERKHHRKSQHSNGAVPKSVSCHGDMGRQDNGGGDAGLYADGDGLGELVPMRCSTPVRASSKRLPPVASSMGIDDRTAAHDNSNNSADVDMESRYTDASEGGSLSSHHSSSSAKQQTNHPPTSLQRHRQGFYIANISNNSNSGTHHNGGRASYRRSSESNGGVERAENNHNSSSMTSTSLKETQKQELEKWRRATENNIIEQDMIHHSSMGSNPQEYMDRLQSSLSGSYMTANDLSFPKHKTMSTEEVMSLLQNGSASSLNVKQGVKVEFCTEEENKVLVAVRVTGDDVWRKVVLRVAEWIHTNGILSFTVTHDDQPLDLEASVPNGTTSLIQVDVVPVGEQHRYQWWVKEASIEYSKCYFPPGHFVDERR